jgi:FkbH-like protein
MEKTLLIIADFNITTFAGYLRNDLTFPKINPVLRPYGQVMQELLDPNVKSWAKDVDYSIIWTRPKSVLPSFKKVGQFEPIDIETLLSEVDAFASHILRFSESVGHIFLPLWTLESTNNSADLIDLEANVGENHVLMQLNLHLINQLSSNGNINLLNTNNWLLEGGKESFSSKLYYLSKSPFGTIVYKSAVKSIKSSIIGLMGQAKKLIVLDLDDTLWGGIVGDLGWENVRLGGHDGIGESFVDFQHSLRALKNKGILLAIVSKNEEDVALEAIDKHPEMVLCKEDFVAWRINWQDKAKNIFDLVEEINLGMQSVVFIDDNPVERDRVRQSLPEVFVPDWPKDKMKYKEALLNLSCFNTPQLSKEDVQRTRMYIEEKKRQSQLTSFSDLDTWLLSLEMKVRIEPLNESNAQRTLQLLNKTNQMNLSTRRLTSEELNSWNLSKNNNLWVLYVSDKFGDYGLTGIVSGSINGDSMILVDFILSCRVFGRKIEQVMLAQLFQYAQNKGLKTICAEYLPTKKNKPTFQFFSQSGFKIEQEHSFSMQIHKKYSFPEGITIDKN